MESAFKLDETRKISAYFTEEYMAEYNKIMKRLLDADLMIPDLVYMSALFYFRYKIISQTVCPCNFFIYLLFNYFLPTFLNFIYKIWTDTQLQDKSGAIAAKDKAILEIIRASYTWIFENVIF